MPPSVTDPFKNFSHALRHLLLFSFYFSFAVRFVFFTHFFSSRLLHFSNRSGSPGYIWEGLLAFLLRRTKTVYSVQYTLTWNIVSTKRNALGYCISFRCRLYTFSASSYCYFLHNDLTVIMPFTIYNNFYKNCHHNHHNQLKKIKPTKKANKISIRMYLTIVEK